MRAGRIALVLGVVAIAAQLWGGRADPADGLARALRPALLAPGLRTSSAPAARAWLNARLDYPMKIRELQSESIELAGVATIELGSQRIGVVLYQVAGQAIALAAWPGQNVPRDDQLDGLQLLAWSTQDTEYWAVSAGDAGVLRRFRAAWLQR